MAKTRKSKPKSKQNINQQSTLRTVHMCVRMLHVYNCRTQHSTEQF